MIETSILGGRSNEQQLSFVSNGRQIHAQSLLLLLDRCGAMPLKHCGV